MAPTRLDRRTVNSLVKTAAGACWTLQSSAVAYGDMTGDGVDETAAFAAYDLGGRCCRGACANRDYYAFVFSGRRVLGKVRIGSDWDARPEDIAVVGGKVRMSAGIWAEGDRSPEPTGMGVLWAVLKGGRLVSLPREIGFHLENLRAVTQNQADDRYPSFSPDGRRLLFASNRGGNSDVYLADTAGNDAYPITNSPYADTDPSFSPDGQRVAFTSARDGNFEIYVTNIDGTGVRRLTSHPAFDITPVFSPDGRRIAFQSNRDGDWEIYIMNDDGSGLSRLTDSPGYEGRPSFSPDGTRMVFASQRNGGPYDIYVMNVDGTGVVRLTNDADEQLRPNYSSDGAHIVFTSGPDYGLYLMNADGTGVTRITGGADFQPAFSTDGRTLAFARSSNPSAYSEGNDLSAEIVLATLVYPPGQAPGPRPAAVAMGPLPTTTVPPPPTTIGSTTTTRPAPTTTSIALGTGIPGDGQFFVGRQVLAGTYQSPGGRDGFICGASGYDATGKMLTYTSNRGPVIFVVLPNYAYVETSYCQPFVRVG